MRTTGPTCVFTLALLNSILHAAPSAGTTPFDLAWQTIDGGGGTSTGGSFQLVGTIGQPDAGTANAANFELHGGFWAHGTATPHHICLGDLVTSATFKPPPDGIVDGADLAVLLGEWGPNSGSAADIVTSTTFSPPPDGVVDGADLAVLLGAWGACN